MKKDKLMSTKGLPFFRFPITKKNKVNNEQRAVSDLGQMTASKLLDYTGGYRSFNALYLGKANHAVSLIQALTRSTGGSAVLLISGQNALHKTGYESIFRNWMLDRPEKQLPSGNGVVILPDEESILELQQCMTGWQDRTVVVCTGYGVYVDWNMLSMLGRTSGYVIVSENISASVRGELTDTVLLHHMRYLLVETSGSDSKIISQFLPEYEYEKPQNNLTLSGHHDKPTIEDRSNHHHRNGFGFTIGQSRTEEKRSMMGQREFRSMRDDGKIFVYNLDLDRAFTVDLSR